MTKKYYINMDATNLPGASKSALGGLFVMHDNLDSPADWDKATFGIPIVADALFLFVCLKGEVDLQLEQGQRKLQRGDVLLMQYAMAAIVNGMSPDISFALLVMSKDFYFPLLSGADMTALSRKLMKDPVVHLEEETLEDVLELYRILRRRIADSPEHPLQQSFAKSQLETIMYILYSHIQDTETDGNELADHRSQEIYSRFLDLLEPNAPQHRDLAFYASELCITPRYLARLVKTASGKNVSQLINAQLLREARRLIRTKRYTMLYVSEYLSFSSRSQFGRWFKLQTGLTPKEYQASL